MNNTFAPVDVVTVAAPGETPSIMIDPCLDAFQVGRTAALNEMLLPGFNTSDDSNCNDLRPAAALVHQLVRKTERNEFTRQLIQFLQDGNYVDRDGVVNLDGVEAAKEITVTVPGTDRTSNLFAEGMRTRGMAIVIRTDGLYINPNVRYVGDAELCQALGVSKAYGFSFYVPSPVAEGSLLTCTEDGGKQSSKLRIALPDGFHLLEGWLKSNGRADKLRRDKWVTEEVANA
jgi:hypothetical protein